MKREGLVLLAIIVAVIGSGLFFRGGHEESGLPGGSTSLVVGTNAIYVAEQAPSEVLSVAVVRLEKPGFVVVHENALGAPGGILGASGLLVAGETNNPVPIALLRLTRDGETLYAMLHLDDGDGIFDAMKDKPALDPINNLPVMMIVIVSRETRETIEPGAVSL